MRYSSATLFGSAIASDNKISVRALLFYEGSHVDSIGKALKISAAQIESIATATNQLLATRRAKFFKDHEYSQDGTIGWIDGEVTAEAILTPPHPGMTDLVGKMGVFGNITIAGEDNITAYNDGLVKEISVGIDIKGKSFGVPLAIYELSAVGIPALAGAALFGLTIEETIARQSAQRRLWQEWEFFTETIHDIAEIGDSDDSDLAGRTIDDADDADDADLAGRTIAELQSQAVEDFADRLRQLFPVAQSPPPTSPEPLTTVPLFKSNIMEYTPEQIKELEAKAAKADALQIELDSAQRSATVSARFNKLKDQAIALRSAGKLAPSKFKAMGFDDADTSIATFTAGDDRALDKLEIQLETIDELAVPVKFGSYLADEPLSGDEGEPIDTDAEMANFKAQTLPWRS